MSIADLYLVFSSNLPAFLAFLFIFVLFQRNFYSKNVGFSGSRTRIVGVQGEHADHLSTTTICTYFATLKFYNTGNDHFSISIVLIEGKLTPEQRGTAYFIYIAVSW